MEKWMTLQEWLESLDAQERAKADRKITDLFGCAPCEGTLANAVHTCYTALRKQGRDVLTALRKTFLGCPDSPTLYA